MKLSNFYCITAVRILVLFVGVMFWSQPLWGDSLRLMTNLEYRVYNFTTKDKATGVSRKTEKETFWQLYNIDAQKELWPNLNLGVGGVFEENRVDNKTDGVDTDRKERAVRPYIDLQLNTQLLQATAGYRESELKLSGSNRETSRRFTEESTGRLFWTPVELPEVDLYLAHTNRYNHPNSTEEKIDRETDYYQLSSRYGYQNYKFDYSHLSIDSRDKVADSKTTSTTDIGTVRYSNSFQQNRLTLNGNARFKRDELEFKGNADRRVPTSSAGSSFYNLDDPPPATSNNVNDFVSDQPLSDVNLMQDGAPQLSFGLDFRFAVDVDTIYVQLMPDDPQNNQASASEVDSIKNLYSWSVFVSDDQMNWTRRTITKNNFDVFENRFEISFVAAKTVFVKIAVTPLPTILLPGKEILLSHLISFRTLPPDTSRFTSTDWLTDMGLDWVISDRTTSSFDILYREERTKPFDGKRTLLSLGTGLNHRFNYVFSGNMRLLRTDVTERGEADRTGHTFSASLAAYYLDTFDQTLTYSFTHNDDREKGTDVSNAFLLRNNLYLYDGLSMTLDGGYSWKNPAERENSNYTFVRVGSSIIPNQWMNFTVYYEMSWNSEDGSPTRREETGRLIASWVPLASLSLFADVLVYHETGRTRNSYTIQQYSVNWSPFRDGTLQFSFLYGMTDDTDGEDTWVVSPSARWQINKKTMLTLDYSVGEREDDIEKIEFDNLRMVLRFFY